VQPFGAAVSGGQSFFFQNLGNCISEFSIVSSNFRKKNSSKFTYDIYNRRFSRGVASEMEVPKNRITLNQ
jgi:hypothetical protein